MALVYYVHNSIIITLVQMLIKKYKKYQLLALTNHIALIRFGIYDTAHLLVDLVNLSWFYVSKYLGFLALGSCLLYKQ